jgi:hypothetical protein
MSLKSVDMLSLKGVEMRKCGIGHTGNGMGSSARASAPRPPAQLVMGPRNHVSMRI